MFLEESEKHYRKIYNDFRKGSPYNVSYISDNYLDLFVEKLYFSKEYHDSPNYELLRCPICFQFSWHDYIECIECNQCLCEECLDNMINECNLRNTNLLCPYCRTMLIEIQNRNNDLTSISISNLNSSLLTVSSHSGLEYIIIWLFILAAIIFILIQI